MSSDGCSGSSPAGPLLSRDTEHPLGDSFAQSWPLGPAGAQGAKCSTGAPCTLHTCNVQHRSAETGYSRRAWTPAGTHPQGRLLQREEAWPRARGLGRQGAAQKPLLPGHREGVGKRRQASEPAVISSHGPALCRLV